jgi:transcriptional regulator with XRE-family HTH domain
MKLQNYLDLHEISQRQAAKQLKATRQYLNAICLGKANPGKRLVKKIRLWSDGAVKTTDLPGWEDFND